MNNSDFRPSLVGYNSRDLPLRWADVLVVGSGIAGLTAALEAARFGSVILITKARLDDSNTNWAQGGIAASLDRSKAALESHEKDTHDAGAGLCDEKIVRIVVDEGANAIDRLTAWGTRFDRDENGKLKMGLEGGHSESRILHSDGDATGREISRALIAQVLENKQIKIMEHVFTIDLVVHDGRCHGVLAWDDVQGRQIVLARATILATGGAGRVYRETTNPKVATGDGVAMAWRAGATIQDIEFVQFHPTTLYVAGASRALISEAVRGEGAHLVDSDGRRFMIGVHPLAELAPRDVVSQAIVRVMKEKQDTNVFLDLSPIKTNVRARFPGIDALCKRYGIDLERDRIPVRPSAHYMVGGVQTDEWGQTTLPQLFAAGEVACTGLHGANRLASNSLLEGLVFGVRAGRKAGEMASARIGEISPTALVREYGPRSRNDLDLTDLSAALGSLMWRAVGIERNAPTLQKAITQIEFWAGYVLNSELAGPRGWELQNLTTVALLIARQALLREESRGTHWRSDFPALDPKATHSLTQRTS